MKYLTLFICLLICSPAQNQVSNNPQPDSVLITSGAKTNPIPGITEPPHGVFTANYGFLSSYEFALSIAVLCFGLLIIILEIFLVKSKRISSDYIVKFIVVTLIITGTLFLITAGYDNNQIAPAAGLFGTIAGYLLGKSTIKKEDNES